jgi:hypothetical protein
VTKRYRKRDILQTKVEEKDVKTDETEEKA